jgi:MFS family permease
VVTAYALAHGSVQLIIGPVGDRFGKYACVTAAAAMSTVLVLLCGLAGSLPALVAARLACGLSAGWIIPLAMAFLGDVIPYERRQQVLGTFLSGQILGQLFGQAAGGVLGDFFGLNSSAIRSRTRATPPPRARAASSPITPPCCARRGHG